MARTSYFKNCTTIEELKKEYKRLMLLYHPDINPEGLTKAQEINAEYDEMFPRLKDVHKTAEGKEYKKETTENVNEYKDIINSIIHFKNVKIEICGSWIWLTGETKPYKDIVKQLGFSWSSQKTAWYYHREDYHKNNNTRYSMNDIRNLWGSREVNTEDATAIA